MRDGFGREIDYLRVSITDRCNLRCRYCMPEPLPYAPDENVLHYDELFRVCTVMAQLGVRRFRVTGGEPLVREGAVDFLADLGRLTGVDFVGLTTNGLLLGESLPALRVARLSAVNISLDTLQADRYRALTGQDGLDAVLASIHDAAKLGLPVKLNCVMMRGVNDDELMAFAVLAERMPIQVRFIELMPLGAAREYRPVPGAELLGRLRAAYPDLTPEPIEERQGGPATVYCSAKLVGHIGFINALSQHFCGGCNRVRLSSQGFLKLCLYHEQGLDLRAMLRGGASDQRIQDAIVQALSQKPKQHHFGTEKAGKSQGLSTIGG